MDKNIILIVGDSWPAGVHDEHDKDKIHDTGIGKLLTDLGYEVRNLSKPGGSNLESVTRLRDFLNCNQHEVPRIKFVLFWTTEFFREIWFYTPEELEEELKHGYSKLKDHWIYRPYYRLSPLSQQWNIPIYIVGGCSDTVWYDDFEKDFPGVKIACQSAVNLILTYNLPFQPTKLKNFDEFHQRYGKYILQANS